MKQFSKSRRYLNWSLKGKEAFACQGRGKKQQRHRYRGPKQILFRQLPKNVMWSVIH